MRRLLYPFLILVILLTTDNLIGQIEFNVSLDDDNETYIAKIKPLETYSGPLSTINNLQMSLVVPSGGFEIGEIENILGQWTSENTVVAPPESPDFDYPVFNLQGNISGMNLVADQEVTLFTFKNTGSCTGDLDFITETDPYFNVAISKNQAIGNQITVLGAGQGNAFSGTFGGAAVCQSNQGGGNSCIVINSVESTPPTQCGQVGGTITISAESPQGLPLQYSIDDGRDYQSDSIFTGLESGRAFLIVVRDVIGNCRTEYGSVELGPPADAIIIGTNSTPDECEQGNGTISIEAVPIVRNTILEYSIDEGATWLENDGNFSNLPAGTYLPRVRAKDAPCFDQVPETVVETACDNPVEPAEGCVYTYSLEANNGVFTVYLLPDTTLVSPFNITSTGLISVKAKAGAVEITNLQNLINGVTFDLGGTTQSPAEAPGFDYFSFGLTSLGTRNITYEKGQKIALFSFENGGDCSGEPMSLVTINDPLQTNNTLELGPQLTVSGTGTDVEVCVDENTVSDCGNEGEMPEDFSTDTIFLTLPVNEMTEFCIGEELEITNIGTVELCNDGTTVVTEVTNGSNCLTFTTDDHFNQSEIVCVVHSDEEEHFDTTYFIICPTVDLGPDQTVCDGEIITLNPIGGTGDFMWETDAEINCTDCLSPKITPDGATEIIVISSDGSGCIARDTLLVDISESPNITNVTATPPGNCAEDGQISIVATSGTDSLRYSIDGGNTFQDDSLFDNLGAGTYQIAVANQNEECVTAYNQQIEFTVNGLPQIAGVDITTPNECTGEAGSILIRASIDTNDDLEYSIDNGDNWSADPLFDNLQPGDYMLMVRIQGGSDCIASESATITEQQTLQITSAPTDRTVCNDQSRSVEISINETIIDYLIEGGNYENVDTSAGTLTFIALPDDSTNYTITLTGESTCTISQEVTLKSGENTDNWDIQIMTTPATCEENDGVVSVVVNEDNTGFTFCWEPNKASGPIREGLSADSSYSLTITGSSGCEVVTNNIRTGTSCEEDMCDFLTGLDTITAYINEDGQAVACMPIQGMDMEELAFFQNGLTANLTVGACMQTSVFYEYNTLLNLGQPPYLLVNWEVNSVLLDSVEFETIEELVIAMNQFDPSSNWALNEDLQMIQGFQTPSTYGSLNLQPVGSSDIAELMLNTMNTMHQSLILENMPGLQMYTLVDNVSGCSEDFYIRIPTQLEPGDIFIYTGLSPNNDQMNDQFTIENIEDYPDNNLLIFNRWGNRIFQKESYTNKDGWDGTFNGQPLPDGVYFYLLRVNVDGNMERFSGAVTIRR